MELILQAIERGGTAGLALVFAVLYIRSELARERLQKQKDELFERTLNALNASTVGMEKIGDAVRPVTEAMARVITGGARGS